METKNTVTLRVVYTSGTGSGRWRDTIGIHARTYYPNVSSSDIENLTRRTRRNGRNWHNKSHAVYNTCCCCCCCYYYIKCNRKKKKKKLLGNTKIIIVFSSCRSDRCYCCRLGFSIQRYDVTTLHCALQGHTEFIVFDTDWLKNEIKKKKTFY